jgi:G:T-mismatch repair DNA endonuclease (very short patch repair protein)
MADHVHRNTHKTRRVGKAPTAKAGWRLFLLIECRIVMVGEIAECSQKIERVLLALPTVARFGSPFKAPP